MPAVLRRQADAAEPVAGELNRQIDALPGRAAVGACAAAGRCRRSPSRPCPAPPRRRGRARIPCAPGTVDLRSTSRHRRWCAGAPARCRSPSRAARRRTARRTAWSRPGSSARVHVLPPSAVVRMTPNSPTAQPRSGVGEVDVVEQHVAGLDDLGDVFRQHDVGRQRDLRPRRCRRLRCGRSCRSRRRRRRPAASAKWTLSRSRLTPVSSFSQVSPWSRALQHQALLAGDDDRAVGEAGHREKRDARPGVGARERLAAVGRVEDAAELADHPAVLVGREAGGEQILTDLAARNGVLRAGRASMQGAPHRREDETPSNVGGHLRPLYSVAHGCGTDQIRWRVAEARPASRNTARTVVQITYSIWNSTLSRSRSRLMPLPPFRCVGGQVAVAELNRKGSRLSVTSGCATTGAAPVVDERQRRRDLAAVVRGRDQQGLAGTGRPGCGRARCRCRAEVQRRRLRCCSAGTGRTSPLNVAAARRCRAEADEIGALGGAVQVLVEELRGDEERLVRIEPVDELVVVDAEHEVPRIAVALAARADSPCCRR